MLFLRPIITRLFQTGLIVGFWIWWSLDCIINTAQTYFENKIFKNIQFTSENDRTFGQKSGLKSRTLIQCWKNWLKIDPWSAIFHNLVSKKIEETNFPPKFCHFPNFTPLQHSFSHGDPYREFPES